MCKISTMSYSNSKIILLFGDENDLLGTVVSGGQLQEFRVPQLVHDLDLLVDLFAIGCFDAAHVLCGADGFGRVVDDAVHDAEAALAQLLMDHVILTEVIAWRQRHVTVFERWCEFFCKMKRRPMKYSNCATQLSLCKHRY